MKQFDAAVIGGGVLGCFVARNLRRWNISTLLLEKEEDVCKGITRANSAIVYAGYDNKPGSLKAAMTVRGNSNMELLCKELDVPFSRCGSLLVTYDEATVPRLEKKQQCGGMARNQHCLREYPIRLLCGDTIAEIQGYPRITGCVTAKGITIPCKTLLIAAGLTPERELTSLLGNPEWLHICGNCNTVHPMVEAVIQEGKQAGIAALKHMR